MPQTPLLCKEGNVQKKSKVHSRRSADFLFQKFQFGPLAHRDQNIAGLNARVGGGIELHHAILTLNSKDDNAVLLAQSQLLERVRNQGTRSADLELFDFQIQVRLPECRSNVEKSGDVRTKHRLGQTMSDESVRRKYGRRSGARQFLFRLLVAGSCGNNEIGIENLRGQRDVYVFRIAADGGDQA